MRRRFIVTYDVCDPKRLRRTFNALRDFGTHLQLSVFECLLNDVEIVQVEDVLRETINQDEDQVLFFDLGIAEPGQEIRVKSLGRTYRPQEVRPVIL